MRWKTVGEGFAVAGGDIGIGADILPLAAAVAFATASGHYFDSMATMPLDGQSRARQRSRHGNRDLPGLPAGAGRAAAYHDGVCEPDAELPADDATTVFICGFVSCDMRPFKPLIHSLPRMMHLGASGVGAWVAPMLRQAASESRRRPAGQRRPA